MRPLAERQPLFRPALAWFSALGSVWVFVLVTLGAFTTSIGAGMVFQDWPLSNGSLNPDGWLVDLAMFAEHSHRLSAALMTFVTLALAAWVWRVDARRWLRRLAIAAVVLVLAQALVGGLRVLLEHRHVEMIDTSVGRLFAMVHAVLAQVFVCTLVAIAAACSRGWREATVRVADRESSRLRALGVASSALLLVQLAIAAVMRHSFAGLAIPTFPTSTASGSWLPDVWDFRVAIHFAHRVMAVVLTGVLVWFVAVVLRASQPGPRFKAAAVGILCLLGIQVYLGASVVWSGRQPHLTTAHVIVGASLLALTFLLTWILHRDALVQPEESAVTKHPPMAENLSRA